MYQEQIKNLKVNLEKTIEYLRMELAGIQTGRATPTLVEDLKVDCYGQKLPIKQLAAISSPEPRLLIVRPWDSAIIKDIERAIKDSRLGLSMSSDNEAIRLNVPSLSEERRKELARILSDKAEECRIAVRRQRGEVWERIQDMEKNKEIREDDKFRAKDELQKIVDQYNEKIEEMKSRKEDEILKV